MHRPIEFYSEILKGRDHLGDLGIYGRIIIKKKLSQYTPCRHIGGEEVQLLLILNLGTRWR
jgi:hypothetical protein